MRLSAACMVFDGESCPSSCRGGEDRSVLDDEENPSELFALLQQEIRSKGLSFPDRYKSKPIEGDEYLLSVVRCIHRNPLEVGQTTAYWTSFDEYMETPRLADTERVLEMLDADPSKAKSAFRLLVESESDGGLPPCGIDNPARLSDREAIMLIREIAGVSECAEVCSLDKARREEAVLLLRARGLSIRQISRLTGLSKGIVERARAGKGQLPSG